MLTYPYPRTGVNRIVGDGVTKKLEMYPELMSCGIVNTNMRVRLKQDLHRPVNGLPEYSQIGYC